jgi:DNA mismatch repair protein MutL
MLASARCLGLPCAVAVAYEDAPSSGARISVLNPALADQIAAGEVVERPASVIKELVENAIDAGATRVDVELEEGGMGSIRVIDNGGGIHPDDLLLAITRHGTSKIRGPEDLVEIATLGFRGEALASVAAVARLTLRSRQVGAEIGSEIRSIPGETPRPCPVGMPVGTQVEVRGLFSNVPARRKFMRSEATEVGHCTETLMRVALVHPEVHLTLRHSKRELVNLPATGLAARVSQILERRTSGPFFAISGVEDGISVQAWLAAPAASAGRSGLFIVTRRRVVKERNLGQILAQALGEALPAGAAPLGCLIVDPPPATVDVNVHPQKSEVRFSDPQRIYAALRRLLVRELAGAPWARGAGQAAASEGASAALSRWSARAPISDEMALGPGPGATEPRGAGRATGGAIGAQAGAPPREGAVRELGAASAGSYRLGTRALEADYAAHKREVRAVTSEMLAARASAEAPAISAPSPTLGAGPLFAGVPRAAYFAAFEDERDAEEEEGEDEPRGVDAPRRSIDAARPPPRFLTCLPGPVALFAEDDAVLAVDLRELRAYLVFQRLMRDLKASKRLAVQGLLTPVVVRRAADEVALCQAAREELLTLGIDLDGFGEDAVVVRGVPAHLRSCLDDADIGDLMARVIPWLRLRAADSERAEPRALLTAIAATAGRDPAPRLARRWIAELHASGEALGAVPGVRRWTAAGLLSEGAC